jgi:hypothetical protein
VYTRPPSFEPSNHSARRAGRTTTMLTVNLF